MICIFRKSNWQHQSSGHLLQSEWHYPPKYFIRNFVKLKMNLCHGRLFFYNLEWSFVHNSRENNAWSLASRHSVCVTQRANSLRSIYYAEAYGQGKRLWPQTCTLLSLTPTTFSLFFFIISIT